MTINELILMCARRVIDNHRIGRKVGQEQLAWARAILTRHNSTRESK